MAVVGLDPDATVRPLGVILAGGVSMPDEACRDRWPDFDDRLPGETREQQAESLDATVTVCRRCPELAVCEG
jgi:hypothetical protein